MLTAAALAAASIPSMAQSQSGRAGPPIIRDAEIEQLLREYTQPILKAAGLSQQNVRVVITSTTLRSTPSWPTASASSSIRAR